MWSLHSSPLWHKNTTAAVGLHSTFLSARALTPVKLSAQFRPTTRNGVKTKRITYLALSAPRAVSRRHADGTESVDSDAEDGVNGAEAGGVVE